MVPRGNFLAGSIARRIAIAASLGLLAALLGLCGALTALTLARADADATQRAGEHAQAVADLAAALDGASRAMAERPCGSFETGSHRSALQKLAGSGGIVIIDPGILPADAVFVAHPTAAGRKVVDFEPQAATLLATLAAGAEGRVATPGLVDRESGDTWAVARRVPANGWWVLAEVSQRHAMAPAWATLRPLWLLPVGAALVLGGLLFALMKRWVARPLKQLSAAVEAVAAGDLAHAVDSRRQDELGDLGRSVEAMRSHLAGVMATVRLSIESIGTASGEIAHSNGELGQRTEHTASHLQRTAMHIGLLARSVGQSADSAAQARLLAASTRSVAQRSGSTLDEIVAHGQRVSDILAEIGAASGEQQEGIASVNGAVADLDRITQQNAALVAQSTAAAGRLKEQVLRLSGVLGTFRLGPDAQATAAPAAGPATVAEAVIRQVREASRPALSEPDDDWDAF